MLPFEEGAPRGIVVERSLLARGANRQASPAVFALGGLQLRKKGRGNNFGSCAIKVDLDSLRKFLVLLPEEDRPISGGLKKDLVDTLLVDCGSVVIVTVSANTLHFKPFQSFPPSISLLYTPAFKLRDISCASKPDMTL